MAPNVAVIYYSATGSVHRLAEALADGARTGGAQVRLRRVPELAPQSVIDGSPAWKAHAEKTQDIPEAGLDDLRWADAYAFGTPARFGLPAAQLKQFLDTSGGLWAAGELADKPVTVFASADNLHGGMEATLLSLSNVFYHWGAVLVPPGYTDASVSAAGGNPYGATYASKGGGAELDRVLAAARHQGARLATYAAAVAALRRSAAPPALAMA